MIWNGTFLHITCCTLLVALYFLHFTSCTLVPGLIKLGEYYSSWSRLEVPLFCASCSTFYTHTHSHWHAACNLKLSWKLRTADIFDTIILNNKCFINNLGCERESSKSCWVYVSTCDGSPSRKEILISKIPWVLWSYIISVITGLWNSRSKTTTVTTY